MTLDASVYDRLGTAIARVVEDHDERRPPFGDLAAVTAPIARGPATDRERALFLTLTSALDRQRDTERLYDTFGRLRDDEPWIFDPATLVGEDRFEDLLALFEADAVGFHRRDAEAWYEIARTLYYYYEGDPIRLFSAHDYERSSVARQVVEASGDTRFYGNNFPMLRGEKTRERWLRLIDDHVHPLGGADGAEIAVDGHVASFTGRLLGEELTTDAADRRRIRRFWRRVCEGASIQPTDVDGPIWYVDRDWETWGRGYLEETLEEAGLELDVDGVVAAGRSELSEQR